MITPLLLQVVATFSFTNGAQVQVIRDTTAAPVVLRVSQGVRNVTQRLDKEIAGHWSYEASITSILGSTPTAPDSLEAYSRALGAFTTRINCGRAGCKATIMSITLWGSTYAYLRPGPLPLPEMLNLGKAMRQAAGLPNIPPTGGWPYVWKQP